MPKRKHNEDDYEHLRKKLKRLERKIRRGKRSYGRQRDEETELSLSTPGTPARLSEAEGQLFVIFKLN